MRDDIDDHGLDVDLGTSDWGVARSYACELVGDVLKPGKCGNFVLG